jgi:hypothetical protein
MTPATREPVAVPPPRDQTAGLEAIEKRESRFIVDSAREGGSFRIPSDQAEQASL